MKKIQLIICLTLLALVPAFTTNVSAQACPAPAADSAPVKISFAKASDKTAKATLENSKTGTVPITFEDGATWDSLKDSYEISGSYAKMVEKGTVAFSVAADGTITYKCICKKGSKKK